MKDNAHLQLLSSIPSASSNITTLFSRAVMEHAYGFTSTKHLDTISAHLSSTQIGRFVLAPKYTICSFSELEVSILRDIYLQDCPSIFTDDTDIFFSQSFQKMVYVTIDGQKVAMGQYILAKYVF